MILLYLFGIVVVWFFIIGLVYLLSPRLSPIPYFPSDWKDLHLITKSLLAEAKEEIIDLGAGTGTVLFPTALEAHKKRRKIRFLGVEINPMLAGIMLVKSWFHPHRAQIRILRKDMFKMEPWKSPTTIYLYVGNLEDAKIGQMLSRFPKGTRVVSYMYKIAGWEGKLTKTVKGHHDIYIYRI